MANLYEIIAQQGATLNIALTLTDGDSNIPMNLSGSSVSGEVKRLYSDTGVLLNLAPQITNATGGQINISISGSVIAGIPVGLNFYNIFVISGSTVTNVLGGNFLVQPTVFAF